MLFVPLSEYVSKTRKKYNDSFTLSQENAKISNVLDSRLFLSYSIENVYGKLDSAKGGADTLELFRTELRGCEITEKEKDLRGFALSAYGSKEFSTKQLEKDSGHATYATIHGFMIKYERLHLRKKVRYCNRTKYAVCW